MILLFGGTTEGKVAAELLDRKEIGYLYSTKRRTAPFPMRFGVLRHGSLDEGSMRLLLAAERIGSILDAAHPFAVELHRTIAEVALKTGVPVIHFERDFRISKELLSAPRVRFVNSFADAVELLEKIRPRHLLAATGVQTIGLLKPYWERHPMKMRILDRRSSLELALGQGFPQRELILMNPSGSQEDEEACIRKHGFDCILCKENGVSGFLPEKLGAAAACGIRAVVVRRPPMPDSFRVAGSLQELERLLVELGREAKPAGR